MCEKVIRFSTDEMKADLMGFGCAVVYGMNRKPTCGLYYYSLNASKTSKAIGQLTNAVYLKCSISEKLNLGYVKGRASSKDELGGTASLNINP
jgi:hypothetical protein